MPIGLLKDSYRQKMEEVNDQADRSKRNFFDSNRFDTPILYIPAERILMSLYTDSIFSFLRAELNTRLYKIFGALNELKTIGAEHFQTKFTLPENPVKHFQTKFTLPENPVKHFQTKFTLPENPAEHFQTEFTLPENPVQYF